MHADTKKYNKALAPKDRSICELLAREIDRNLPEAENKIWHAHPVWFLDENPVVGYSKLKDCVRLLFWSGQSFKEKGLKKEGTFKAAEVRYTSAEEVDVDDLERWLAKARDIQWDYKNVVRRKAGSSGSSRTCAAPKPVTGSYWLDLAREELHALWPTSPVRGDAMILDRPFNSKSSPWTFARERQRRALHAAARAARAVAVVLLVVTGGAGELAAQTPAQPSQPSGAEDAGTAPASPSQVDAGEAADAGDAASDVSAPHSPEKAAAPTTASSPAPPAGSAGASTAPPPIAGFVSPILSGGSTAELVVDVQPSDVIRLPERIVEWTRPQSCDAELTKPQPAFAHSKVPHPKDNSKTVLAIPVPEPPCNWPFYQEAKITVTGDVKDRGNPTLFEGTVRVSVWWFPLLVTVLAVALIYPGFACFRWGVDWLKSKKGSKPSFLRAIDPVQITANAYGRPSLAKLQIFVFSLLVFGLLLHHVVRTGKLIGLSNDVLLLLGISAAGTLGGRLTLDAKRRLKFDNWAWLVEKGWLEKAVEASATRDVAARARWRELLVDPDTREFDIYSFQMAIFSLVVAAALLLSNVTELSTFEVPPQLLGLLGVSNVVFVLGKVSEKSGFKELDDQLDQLQSLEREFQAAKAKEQHGDPNKQADAKAEAEKARTAFKTGVKRASEMFWTLYRDVLEKRPASLEDAEIEKLEPDC